MPKKKHAGGRPLGAKDSHPRQKRPAGTLRSFRADKTTMEELEFLATQEDTTQTTVILRAIHYYFEHKRASTDPASLRTTVSMSLPSKENWIATCPKCGFEIKMRKELGLHLV
ncbi:MAG: hypothetical protein RBG13Loki_1152 [Promethearchaeota archaeon CR_4]|nr:MAG: hypothetical protein RBG13Loki_1152 [Candidatus Lokiarchaeota archaeon CR_4]